MASYDYKAVRQDPTTEHFDSVNQLQVILTISLSSNFGYFYRDWKSGGQAQPLMTDYGISMSNSQALSEQILIFTTAGLIRNKPVPFVVHTTYNNINRTIADEAWSAPVLDPATGLIALPDDISKSMKLPPAQRWPWDENKGIYLLNAYHNLHCLVSAVLRASHCIKLTRKKHVIRAVALDFFDGRSPSKSYEHIVHCLNVLREEIMCNADDTPRYTGPLNAQLGSKHPYSGIGQTKMCNDWGKLESFALENSACYKPVNKSTPGFPTVERYKFCPDGKVLWP
ncbi:hypothetical protein BOTCAL_0398g00030 [Botryotinia calthae]|uniref:Uncharacterized protein n=1 Tax=Botryotinia calthae TaxID=38488 RepID=A0A4Y8CR91_9HELO|nr:hypothetical protein BOTCAL_0398g00030 [Botryotinia calthae]